MASALAIPPAELALHPSIEGSPRIVDVGMEIDPAPASAAYPSPFTRQGSFAEQRRFDRERVIPRHVPLLVDPFEDKDWESIRTLGMRASHRRTVVFGMANVQFNS